MNTFINLIPLITGIYLISFSFLITTKNIISCLLYQILPFFLGLGCIFSACKLFNWI